MSIEAVHLDKLTTYENKNHIYIYCFIIHEMMDLYILFISLISIDFHSHTQRIFDSVPLGKYELYTYNMNR